jgi:hypothetical protein
MPPSSPWSWVAPPTSTSSAPATSGASGTPTAYEIATSINSNAVLGFSASTAEAGTKVRVFAKTDTEEDIEVTSPSAGTDANLALLFAPGRVDTMRLYKNDRLLSKDGQPAVVQSRAPSFWGTFVSGETLIVSIDGTASVTYTFVDQDFIDAKTGYTAVGRNSVAAWAKVLNAKVPGITAVEANGLLEVTSNIGSSSRAQIKIIGGTLVNPGQMFVAQTVTGLDNDYTLDRNTGQIRLEVPLEAGDSLSTGTFNTRAFVESPALTATTLSGTGKLWASVDGGASIVSTGLNASTALVTTVATAETWGGRIRVTASASVFTNVKTGDWVIIWDSAINAAMRGIFRVAQATGTWFELERNTTTGMAQGSFTLSSAGMVFVRASSQIQALSFSAGSYTAKSFVDALNAQIKGAEAATFRTNAIRVNTNSFSLSGDIAVVAADTEGLKSKLPVDGAEPNLSTHLAVVESGSSQAGTPEFTLPLLTAGTDNSSMVLTTTTTDIKHHGFIVGLRTPQEVYNSSSPVYRHGHNLNRVMGIGALSGSGTVTVALRDPSLEQTGGDRVYLASSLAIGPQDDITVVVDQDTTSKRFTVPLYRTLKPVGTTYGSTNTFKDADNSGASLAVAFGLGYDFNDFALYMQSRFITDSGDTSKSIIWRYTRPGPDGDTARMRYSYPVAAAQPVTVTTHVNTGKYTDISVLLPSGPLKTGYSIRATTKIGTAGATGTGGQYIRTYALGYSISSATRDGSGNVTLTLTLPNTGAGALATVTNHGFNIGDALWVQSTSGSFGTGVKTLTAVSSTTVTYVEAGSAITNTNIGTVSFDPIGQATFSGASPAPIAVGDIINIDSPLSGLAAEYEGLTMRIGYMLGNQVIQCVAATAVTPTATTTWTAIGSSAAISIYSIAGSTASAIATAVKALADAKNSVCPITAKVTGSGSGTILLSSDDSAATANTWNSLSDGVNYVLSTTSPGSVAGDYQLSFKKTIASGLATGSDWANEVVRLVPLTAKNLVAWMNTLTVTGISSVATVDSSSRAQKLQIASQTPGTAGSVQVQGGSGNGGTAAVSGSALLITDADTSTYAVATVPASDAQGYFAGMWMQIQNTAPMPKSVIQATTTLVSLATNGTITLDTAPNTPFWSYSNSGPVLSHTWQIEKQGRYTCFSYDVSHGSVPNLVGAKEGDWVRITTAATPTANSVAVSTANQGIFRVVRVEDGTVGNSSARAFWIENDSSLEETVEADIAFFTFDSVMPGDQLSISTDLWNPANKGVWTVESVGVISGVPFTNSAAGKHTIKLVVSGRTPVAVSSPGALGTTQYRLVQVIEALPSKLIKRIRSIAPNQSDGTFVDIKFSSSPCFQLIGNTAGSIMSPLDKLGFDTELAVGVDGYSHTTGLIAEANRVVYGDASDSAAYPGVVAAGANLNISGPLVKRITCALNIRVRSGVSTTDVTDRVKSAVAAVINGTGIGEPIAISDLVNAASKVNGVIAVSIISPTYNSESDLVSVQPYEKPLVLNLETDVQVSLVGQ